MNKILPAFLTIGLSVLSAASAAQESEPVNTAPTAEEWAAMAALPDLSGIWIPDTKDQYAKEKTDIPPWTPKAKARIDAMLADQRAGAPHGIFTNCMPQGMPTWMLITHNAMEFLVTPKRVTLIGETDGNAMRRIYTDGRQQPEDPDLTFAGYSTGRWENGALIVETRGIRPETLLAISEAAGVPSNGGMQVSERISLISPNVLQNELVITAPNILTGPWKTTRKYFRERRQKFDIVGGVCIEGFYDAEIDKDGNAVFVPMAPLH